jgi:uncharacterized protein
MLTRWLKSLGALTLAGFLAGPAPAKSPEAVAAEAAVGNTPAIWTIEKPQGGTITMFGSVHLLPKDKQWRTAALDEALAKADVVVFELDLDAAMAEMQKEIMETGTLPLGVTLTSLMTPDQVATVKKAADKVGVPMAMLEPYKPWFAMLMLMNFWSMAEGLDPNAGVESVLKADAKAQGKAFDFFETAKQQLDLFRNLTDEQAIEAFVIGARDVVEKPDMFKDLLTVWAKGDVEGLDKLMNSSMAETPELAKALLEDRNRNWAEKIEGTFMTDTKNYLIIGGAAHFAGQYSVQTMLREKGIAVTGP